MKFPFRIKYCVYKPDPSKQILYRNLRHPFSKRLHQYFGNTLTSWANFPLWVRLENFIQESQLDRKVFIVKRLMES
jgi:hypothetical protein